MALLDVFKKSKKAKETKRAEKIEKPAPVVLEKPKKILGQAPRQSSGQAFRAIKKPHVTEKASDLVSKNQYIFDVFHGANKNQIAKAVEDIYGVDVTGVNTVNVPRKRRRLGRTAGWRGGYKKAIVKIKEGQKIEVLS